MSRRPTKFKGVKLPHALQQELGLALQGRGRSKKNAPGSRKLQRKAGRVEKRAANEARSRRGRREDVRDETEDYLPSDGEDEPEVRPHTTERPSISTRKADQPSSTPKPPQTIPKSILKKHALQPVSESSEDTNFSRESSPGLVLDSSSKSFKERAAKDDADILALEKKLGLKNNKKTKVSELDGLEDLLGELSSEDEGKKRKREADDWLERKRRKAVLLEEGESDEDIGFSDGEDDSDVDDQIDLDEQDIDSGDDFAGFESQSSQSAPAPASKKPRENPYVAPVDPSVPVGKYIPPSLRKRADQDTESLTSLKRQIQGHLNKLSEANLISILNEVEKFYQSNPRQDLTSTLIELLLSLFCDRSSLQSTFVILHAAFIASIYKVIGTDFGAELVSRLIERFDGFYQGENETSGKETVNLISLLSHLYTFHVVNGTIVFDYIRMFLEELNETNTELILKVVRDCGPQLRQDDPSSLKSIVQIMQNATGKIIADGGEMSVRTKFMIDMITDLKNNKMKAAQNTSGVAIEHITLMRKVLGSLNSRNLRASEPLRISLKDIKDSDRKGKWWLVGASWKGNESTADEALPARETNEADASDSPETDFLALAREYRMNTDVRRSIFVAIMSASDWSDANIRLMKLRLKRSQEQEIPRVLLRCLAAEAVYNPYYTLIAKKLCTDKRMKKAFQFGLWDFFKRMGEKGDVDESDNDEDEEQNVQLSEILNFAKMYGYLIADGGLSIGVLKTLNLAYLKEKAGWFVELLLTVILTPPSSSKGPDAEQKRLASVFAVVADAPGLLQGLQYFLKKKVQNSDFVGERERAIVKKGCKVALDVLGRVAGGPEQAVS